MDCPKLKKPFKKFKKKKTLKATWDESSESKDKEIGDQVAQMCFMAMEESSNEVTLNDDVVEFSYDELVSALKVMNDELELSHKKNKLLKSELAYLRKENETSSKDDRPLDRKDKLDAILDPQRSPSIRYGLGYNKFTQAPPSKTTFVKASSSNEPSPQVPSPKLESKWYLDSGCSRHMTRNANLFLSLEKRDGDVKCFVSISDNSQTWHRKLAHASVDLFANLNKDKLVDGLPKIKFQKDKVCDACQMDKFGSKINEGIFLGYSISSKVYRVFNKRTLVVEESMHVVFDEANSFGPRKDISYDDDIIGNFDELTLEDPQSSENQDQLNEDPLKDLGDDEVEL
ncbi:uncharacterized protein LOC131178464 [Hevea brasiliensis]|uniref:uncharacterized protein LOC131178464 n=1 Tax=Hevea brasiliensis TaxID=3981 RepID=UPI0025D80C8F|nr:uncharacterized protein LOC131178464 [Hevea brasiliensis]